MRSTVSSSCELKSTTFPVRQLHDQTAQNKRRCDIQSGERLIQKNQVGVVHQRRREQDLLPHSFGVRGERHIPVSIKPKQPQKAPNALNGRAAIHVPQCGDHHQVFHAAEVRIKVRLFGNIAQSPPEGHQVLRNGASVKQNLTRARFNQARDDLHGGGFAGAVCAEIAGYLSCARDKAHSLHRRNAGVTLMKLTHFERRVHRYLCSILLLRRQEVCHSSSTEKILFGVHP